MPGIFFAATILASRVADRLGDGGRGRIAGMPHRLRQVRRPDEKHIDAFDLEDVIDIANGSFVLELHADQRLFVGGRREVQPSSRRGPSRPGASPPPARGPRRSRTSPPMTARRASSAVLTCGTCTPMTPRSITLWISALEFVRGPRDGGDADGVGGDAPSPRRRHSDSEPCSQSSSTQSKPAWPSISTICGDGNITEQPSAGSPAAAASAFMRFGFIDTVAYPEFAARAVAG